MDLSTVDTAKSDRELIEELAKQLYSDYTQWIFNTRLDDLPPDAEEEDHERARPKRLWP